MARPETLEQFTRNQDSGLSLNSQFNVFELKAFIKRPMSYGRRDFFKISLMTEGSCRMIYADRGVEVSRPALIFANPMVPYSCESTSATYSGYFCLFSEDFLQPDSHNPALQESPLFKRGGDPIFFLEEPQVAFVKGLFENMLKEFHSDYPYKNELSRHYVHLILHEAMKLQPNKKYFEHTNASSRLANLFLELLDKQFPVDSPHYALQLRSPRQYAERLAVHVNHLNYAVREVTGKTTTQHIAEKMVAEAKALLTHSSWSISEIAFSLGYEYPSYFNNFFKKQTGLTPGSFR